MIGHFYRFHVWMLENNAEVLWLGTTIEAENLMYAHYIASQYLAERKCTNPLIKASLTLIK